MIEIRDVPYFRECVKHAKEVGAWECLRNKLRWLHCPREWKFRNTLKLFKDFAPFSFEFSLHSRADDRFLYNGGIIYYAGAESGVAGPQFSVTLSGKTHARYEVHT